MALRRGRATAQRFGVLWQRCASVPPSPSARTVYRDLAAHLDTAGRAFHNMRHVDDCLLHFDEVASHLADPDAVELALWFHDVVYVSGDPANERRSAELFLTHAAGVPVPLRRRIVALILATERRQVPRTPDARFVDDIDLAGFGGTWEAFARNSRRLRRESASVDDDTYHRGQWKFLSQLRCRRRFFRTAYFRDRYEKQAYANLDRLLAELERRGYGERGERAEGAPLRNRRRR